MQMKDAEALRKQWGGKPCNHPTFAKEYALGTSTTDYICTQCGASFGASEVAEIRSKRGR
jgi:hypothetical protein